MVQCRRQRLRVGGDIHQPDLQRGRDGEAAADQEQRRRGGPHIVRRDDVDDPDGDIPEEHAGDGRHEGHVGELRAHDVAGRHAEAEHGQHQGHGRERQPRHLRQRRTDVGIDREETAGPDRRDGERQPDLRTTQRAEFDERARRGSGGPGHDQDDEQRGDEPHAADAREGEPPAERLAEPGDERRAHHGGDGQPHHDAADRAGATAGRGLRGDHQRGHTEIGAMRHAGEETEHQQRVIPRGQGAREVAEHEDRHQSEQQRAARQLGGQHGDDRRADHDAERVGADDVAGRGLGDVERLGEVRQKAHRGELAGADGEAADRQGEFDQRRAAPVGPDIGRRMGGAGQRGVCHGSSRFGGARVDGRPCGIGSSAGLLRRSLAHVASR